jgi:hypothetical protein
VLYVEKFLATCPSLKLDGHYFLSRSCFLHQQHQDNAFSAGAQLIKLNSLQSCGREEIYLWPRHYMGCVISFTLRLLYTQGNNLRYPSCMRLFGPQSRPQCFRVRQETVRASLKTSGFVARSCINGTLSTLSEHQACSTAACIFVNTGETE